MKMKKLAAVALTVVFGASLFAGCGNNNSGNTENAGGTEQTAPSTTEAEGTTGTSDAAAPEGGGPPRAGTAKILPLTLLRNRRLSTRR